MPTGHPPGNGDAAVGGRHPAHRGPTPGADLPVVGLGAMVFGLGAIVLGIRQVRLGEHRSERFLGVALLLGGTFTVIDGLVCLLTGAYEDRSPIHPTSWNRNSQKFIFKIPNGY